MDLRNNGLDQIRCMQVAGQRSFRSGKSFSPPVEQSERLRSGEGNRPSRKPRPTSVRTDSCSVGRMLSTLRIRSRRAIPTDCGQEDQRCQTRGSFLLRRVPLTLTSYLNYGDVLLRLHVWDVVLELHHHLDQAHDRLVDFVVGAVQLGRGRRLKQVELWVISGLKED